MNSTEFMVKIKQRGEMLKELNSFLFVDRDSIDIPKYTQFIEDHVHKDENFGAIGGHIQFNITKTSIGLFVSVKCTHCDMEEDITEYSNY